MRISATTLQTGLVVIILSWALVPQLADDSFARLLCVLSVAIWGGVEATKPHGIFRRPPVVMLLYFFFCVYTLLLEFMTHGASGAISRLQLYIMLFFLPLFVSLRNAPERLYFLFWVFISLNALAMTTTYLYLSSFDARAMRVVVRASQEAIELQNAGVGGLAMAYNAALLFPVLLVASLQPALVEGLRPPRLLRIVPKLPLMLVWYSTALSALIVISSQFSIAVISTLIGTTITLFLWRLSAVRLLLLLTFIVITLTVAQVVLQYLLQFVQGTNYLLKITDLLESSSSGQATGVVYDRFERYLRSLTIFFESPFIGALYFTDIGKHSTMLDMFARWGVLLGGVFLSLLMYVPLHYFRKCSRNPGGFGLVAGAVASTLALLTMGTGVAATGAVLFLVYPAVFSAFVQSSQGALPLEAVRSGASNA